MKTFAEMQSLITDNKVEELRLLSQHCINNSMYKLRFGLHNLQGIHGACPMDMLHALLLGIFRYTRDCFFEQIGVSSKLSDDFNAHARQHGDLISRQSDRDFPKTRFASGTLRGKLNAKDFPGILLCMSAAFRCRKVRLLLPKKRRSLFQDGVLNDWQLLVDVLLQWEQWLKSDKLMKNHVKLSERKHRHLMYLIKKVGRRATGMGLKITKFHSIMHITDDILNFGVPMEVDTGSNESGHKKEKVAAKLTQKKKEFFDQQTANRLEEVELLDYAEAEINGKIKWNYYEDLRSSVTQTEHHPPPKVGGVSYYVEECGILQRNVGVMITRKKGNHKMIIEQDLLNYVHGLQKIVEQFIPRLVVHSVYHRFGNIFRANSNFMKHVWRDWALFDWGEEGHLPSHILGFVDLSVLPDDFSQEYGESGEITTGIYAIVECATIEENEEEHEMSCLYVPINKIIGGYTDDFVSHRKFYLADCEAIISPIAVIPNLGGKQNAYLQIKPRSTWKNEFIKWLENQEDNYDEDSSDEETDNRENYDMDSGSVEEADTDDSESDKE